VRAGHLQPLYSRTSILHHIPPASSSAVELQQPVLRLFFLTFTPRYQYRSTHMHSSHFSASLLFRTNSTLGKISGTESWARPTTLVPPTIPSPQKLKFTPTCNNLRQIYIKLPTKMFHFGPSPQTGPGPGALASSRPCSRTPQKLNLLGITEAYSLGAFSVAKPAVASSEENSSSHFD